jgi:CubicO group peptidase (beta-lactamase class C family)
MKKLFFAFFLLTLSVVPLLAQDDGRFQRELQPLIEKLAHDKSIPGFAIGIVQNQKVVYAAGFGVANINEPQRKITTRSLFHMASVTKTFVATSIMQLVENGQVDLDAPVVKYLPYFRLKDKRYGEITVRQMLSHISGMPDVDDYGWDKPQFDDGALERYVRSLANLKLDSPPGTKFAYSNIAFEVLGDLIAKVSGESFEGYVQKHILKPLGMKDSTLLLKEADKELLTTPHVLHRKNEVVVSKIFPYNRMHAPSSTLYSNVDDMTRWAIANLNYGDLDGHRILKRSTYDVMWQANDMTLSKAGKVGISWFVSDYRNHKTVSHGGADTGSNSFVMLLPDDSIGLVMMTNSDFAFDQLREIIRASLDLALGIQNKQPPGNSK